MRITDSPDAEAGPQRGAFRDAHGHPSLVSPHEAVLRSHLSISSFRSLWSRTLQSLAVPTVLRGPGPGSSRSQLDLRRPLESWSPPKFIQPLLRPQLRRSHVVLQRLRGDCHCRLPEDRVRGSETAAKPPAGGVADWLPSFSAHRKGALVRFLLITCMLSRLCRS